MLSLSEQLAQLRGAIARAPQHPGLRFNLGVLLHSTGDIQGAALAYQIATQLKPDFHQAWNNLGLVLEDMGRRDDAKLAYQRALGVFPEYPSALKNLGRLASIDEESEMARACYLRLGALEPDNWPARLAGGLMLPAVHASVASMAQARRQFAAALDGLLNAADSLENAATQRLAAVERHTNFYLAYHGEDDRPLQEGYAQLVRRLLAGLCPERSCGHEQARSERVRVGFASCFFRECTVGHYFQSWITGLDPKRFEVFLIVLGGAEDALTEKLCSQASTVLRLEDPLPVAAERILDCALDALIYPELGMNGRTYALAALRLAPVQCAAWGHPVTSGHQTIDYFLSCDLMEPKEAAAHYTERLVRLPGIGTSYEKPVVGMSLARADFGLPTTANLYLLPHAPYKVHPEQDSLIAAILAADPDGLLVLCDGFVSEHGRRLRDRLESALRQEGVATERIRLLPHQPRASFLELNRVCDVMLDWSRWSGGNTTLDALAAGLPVVTRAGEFMRGRQSAAMLKIVEVVELIADSDAQFVEIALRLGQDKAWNAKIRERILDGARRLYADQNPIEALGDFLISQCT